MPKAKIYRDVVWHLILGFLALRIGSLANYWLLLYFAYACFDVVAKKNAGGEAHWYAIYFVSYEAFYRMTGTSFLPYEFGKYSVSLLLLIGLGVETKKKNLGTSAPYLYFLLLVPAALLTEFGSFNENRKQIFFYLSGPFCLMASYLYFYGRQFDGLQLRKMLYFGSLGAIPMLIYLYGYTPVENIEFTTDANFAATGGFGSNQVSTAIGLVILYLVVAYFRRDRLFVYRYFDWFLLAYATFRGLLSFSRGGMIIPVLAIMVALFLFGRDQKFVKQKITNLIPKLVAVAIIFSGVFYYANQLTGDKLMMRYQGINEAGEQKEVTSGRLEMVNSDWELFKEYWVFGTGVGMAKVKRSIFGSHIRASHTEITRMLAEHGTLGIISLLILLGGPLVYFMRLRKQKQTAFFLIMMTIFALGTMGHSAMRMAIPAFIYGFGFIAFKDDSPPRKQTAK